MEFNMSDIELTAEAFAQLKERKFQIKIRSQFTQVIIYSAGKAKKNCRWGKTRSSREICRAWSALCQIGKISLSADLRANFLRSSRCQCYKSKKEANHIFFRYCWLYGHNRAPRIRRTNQPYQFLPKWNVNDCTQIWRNDW